jgi:hypothetical protein
MEKKDIDELVDEYLECAPDDSDTELRLVDAALFAEDCFGLVVGEVDFSESALGPGALRAFVRQRIGQ